MYGVTLGITKFFAERETHFGLSITRARGVIKLLNYCLRHDQFYKKPDPSLTWYVKTERVLVINSAECILSKQITNDIICKPATVVGETICLFFFFLFSIKFLSYLICDLVEEMIKKIVLRSSSCGRETAGGPT